MDEWSLVCGVYFFFFFKQKTAYEISVRDWSSDVCSSDLAGSALMAELKTPTSPLVLSKPQTHAARVALPQARPGSRLWWGVGGLGGLAIAAALWWLAPWRAWLTPSVSAPPPSRDTVRVSQAPPPAVPTDITSGRGAPVPAPTHVARPPSRARVPARSPAAGVESAARAPVALREDSVVRSLRARALNE